MIICGCWPRQGCSAVVLVPIGFICDHMEVIFDLDTEAVATAAELGLPCVRAATAGVHRSFVAGLVDLMLERAAAERGEDPPRPVVEDGVVGWYVCRSGLLSEPAGTRAPERWFRRHAESSAYPLARTGILALVLRYTGTHTHDRTRHGLHVI